MSINRNVNSYTSNNGAVLIDSEKFLKRSIRKDFSSTCFIVILAHACLQIVALILSLVYSYLNRNIPLPDELDSIPNNLLNGVISLLCIGALSLVFLSNSQTAPKKAFIFGKVGALKTLRLFFIGFSVCMLSNVITSSFLSAMKSYGFDLSRKYDSPDINSPSEALVAIFAVAVVPAITEEMLFRGVILTKLKPYGQGFAVVVSSVLFSLMHGNFVQIPFTLFVGLVLGYVTIYSGSILPAMLIHFANNGYSVLSDIVINNLNVFGISAALANILLYLFLFLMMVLGIVSVIKLAKNDDSFLFTSEYEGSLSQKSRNSALFTAPGFIVALIYFISNSFLSLI